MRKPTFEIMSDLLDHLSDTNTNEGAIALSADPITAKTAIAPFANPTAIAPVIAPSSTNPYLVYLSQLAVFFAAHNAGISKAYCPDGK